MTVKNPAIKPRNNALKDTRGDKIFFVINAIFLGLLALIILYPLYFIVIASFSDPDAVLGGQVVLAPVNITFEGYEKVFQRQDIWNGYWNTIWYTVVTVILALAVTVPAGWGLSRKTTPGKKFWMLYFIIPMFFGGGLIPFYNVMSSLKLINSPWASGGHAGSSPHRRRGQIPHLLLHRAAPVQGHHRRHGAVLCCGPVEQLLQRHDLPAG